MHNLGQTHLVTRINIMSIKEYDVVALMEDLPTLHKDTQQAILLHQGRVGTVLMLFDEKAGLIDFSDTEGRTYAMETVPLNQLIVLLHEPEAIAV